MEKLDDQSSLSLGEKDVEIHHIGRPVTGQIDELVLGLPAAGPTATQEKEAADQWKKWEPQRLNSRHREIMRRILEGSNETQIAEQMGLSRVAVCLVVTSPLFRAELEKMEAERDDAVISRAEALSNEALDTLKNQMRSAKSESIRNRAANDILDRAGYSKVEKRLVGIVNAEDVIRELNRNRREAFQSKIASNQSNQSQSTDPLRGAKDVTS
jgi:hypothetical protein